MLPLLAALTPNTTVLILTLGIILIAVELNRPGWVVPGALGLLLSLLSLAIIARRHPAPLAIGLVLSGSIILLLQLRYEVQLWIVVLGTVAGVAGLGMLHGVSFPLALACGLALGAGTTVLTGIARRARRNKGLD